MGISKVVYGGETLIDLTSDTVSADKLALGATAHAADGEAVVGTLQSIYTVKGTQTANTGAWKGAIDLDALYDGLTIAYYLPRNGSENATLNLTLKGGGTTGAIPVYATGTTRMTTQYTAGSTIYLTYWSAGSISVNGTATTEDRWTSSDNLNSNWSTFLQLNGAVKAKSAIVAKNICVGDSGGYWHLKAGSAFDIRYPILWANAACNAGSTRTDFCHAAQVAIATTQSMTLTAYKPVYIKGTLSGTLFTPVSTTPLTQTEPTSADGYQYMLLGYAYSTTTIYLLPYHPIFVYSGGKLRQFDATQKDLDELFGSNSSRRFEVDSSGNLYYVVD